MGGGHKKSPSGRGLTKLKIILNPRFLKAQKTQRRKKLINPPLPKQFF